jgi:hypothetical protein
MGENSPNLVTMVRGKLPRISDARRLKRNLFLSFKSGEKQVKTEASKNCSKKGFSKSSSMSRADINFVMLDKLIFLSVIFLFMFLKQNIHLLLT